MKKESPKFYGCLMKSFSVGSTVIIKKHVDFVAAELASNPVLLFAIVRSTHLTNVSGGGPEMVVHEEETKEREFNSFMQSESMDLSTFYKSYTEYRTILTSMHVTAPSGPREAMKFLLKLDPKRHGRMLLQLENAAIMGTPYPQTLAEAYQRAGCWKVEKSTGTDVAKHTNQSSYVLADEAAEPTRRSKRPRNEKQQASKGTASKSGRGNGGGREPTGVLKSDVKKKVVFAKTASRSNTSGWVVPDGCEPDSRTCKGCLKKGAYISKLPRQSGKG
mmetsp:Transcript_3802/g.5379  ORF Transcript_3802/g.5379 Transcript_3802/m.5379 type:complete len:275 (-) Transcript_3802:2086-2910(-)